MKLKQIKANMTEVTLGEGRKVLFSYSTPVAYITDTPEGRIFYRTEEMFSRTTTRHIKSWLPFDDAIVESQTFFDWLVV